MSKEMAVIGRDLFTLGFKLAGVRRSFNATEPEALHQAVQEALNDDGIGILVMETDDVQKLEAPLRRQLEESIQPTLVAIGSHEDTALREKLKQAIGVDVWK
jgi:V/A-type H+-transporting ATPase subunit F